MANQQVADSYALGFASSTRSIECAVGLQLAALRPLPRRVEDHTIIVLVGVRSGALDFTSPSVIQVSDWLRGAMQNPTVTLMCVCSGSVVAAHAGLLSNR